MKPNFFFKYWMCQAQMFFKCQICQSPNVYIPNNALPDSFTEGSFIYSLPQYHTADSFSTELSNFLILQNGSRDILSQSQDLGKMDNAIL